MLFFRAQSTKAYWRTFFGHNLGSLLQAFRLWGLRKEMWAEKKKQREGGVGVRARELGVPSSLPLRLFLLTFFLAPSFASHSTIRKPGTGYNFRRDASAPPPQVETLLFDWFWSCLTNASLRVQKISYCSTLQETGRRLSAWSKRNQGARMKTSGS